MSETMRRQVAKAITDAALEMLRYGGKVQYGEPAPEVVPICLELERIWDRLLSRIEEYTG